MRWTLLVAGVVLSHLALGEKSTAPTTHAVTERVRAYRAAHEKEILQEFAALLSIPNHASDAVNIRHNADALVKLLQSRGIEASLLEAEGAPPVVFGELSSPGTTRTVSFYAHYDGQPVDAREWASDPFHPQIRDRPMEQGGEPRELALLPEHLDPEMRLYARSTSDDKAPIVGFLTALDALRAAGIAPSVNLKFFFEGEEEVGSPHLASILDRYAPRLATDLWILCDGPVHQSGRMEVFFGARGATSLDITVYGPIHNLHSGHYGNWAPNPINLLTHLLDSMRDTDARILIPGFNDDVRPLTRADQVAILEIPDEDAQLRAAFQIEGSEGQPASLIAQILKPALNVHGFQSGRVGRDAANVINNEATASIDFRLVPDQTPDSVQARTERYIAQQGFFVVHQVPDAATRRSHRHIANLTWGSGYPAARTPLDLPASRAVVATIEGAVGAKIIRMPALGGSVPMYLFQHSAGRAAIPVIGVPIANYDNNQHAANENIRLQNLWDGIEIYAVLFSQLGPALHDTATPSGRLRDDASPKR
ncbi:MAG: M20/M25/M40 family metallo-hydrolase [Steroidobacteraceae bacterium]